MKRSCLLCDEGCTEMNAVEAVEMTVASLLVERSLYTHECVRDLVYGKGF